MRFQTAAVIIGTIFIAAVLMNGVFFYAINGLIVGEMKIVIEGINDVLQSVSSAADEDHMETTVIN